MRILLVTGSYPPMHCGVGDYTCMLARAISGVRGSRVGILTSKAASTQMQDEAIEVFPVMENWSLRDLRQVLTVLRAWRPDIVHIQFPTQGYGQGHLPTLMPLLCWLKGIRVVQTWHEARHDFGIGNLAWLLCQSVVPGAVIMVRPRLEEAMPNLLKNVFRRKSRRYIPNGPALPAIRLTEAEREEIRGKIGRAGAALIVYFGFVYPEKGIEQLFELADPEEHHVVLIGERPEGGPRAYFDEIMRIGTSGKWSGRTTMTGFLETEEAARIIAAADAVVLPFRSGGGEWNTSIHSAQVQGTFVLTTSTGFTGYKLAVNTYYAAPGDIAEMRDALKRYVGRKNPSPEKPAAELWSAIAEAHRHVYQAAVSGHGRVMCDAKKSG